MLRPVRYVFGSITLLLVGCSPVAVSDAACDVAVIHAAKFLRETQRPTAVWTHPGKLGSSSAEIEDFLRANPGHKSNPEIPLLRAAAKVQHESVVERCSGLRAALLQADVLTDDAKIERVTRGDDWPVEVLGMSMPVLSSDGSTAFLYASEYAGPLGGGISAVTYKKDGRGVWVIAKSGLVVIS